MHSFRWPPNVTGDWHMHSCLYVHTYTSRTDTPTHPHPHSQHPHPPHTNTNTLPTPHTHTLHAHTISSTHPTLSPHPLTGRSFQMTSHLLSAGTDALLRGLLLSGKSAALEEAADNKHNSRIRATNLLALLI